MFRSMITIGLVLCLTGLAAAQAPATPGSTQPAGNEVVMSFPLLNASMGANYKITRVDQAKGEVILEQASPTFTGTQLPSEGYTLILVRTSPNSAPNIAVRAQVTEILADGAIRATVGPGARDQLKPGPVDLVRPVDGLLDLGDMNNPQGPRRFVPATTAALRGLPDILQTSKPGPKPGELNPITTYRLAAQRAASTNNLKQIMIAMHNFESANGVFPPAVVYGPDGKPWHSWRVLILPYIEQNDLYNKYDFTQPWDSPRNLEVAKQVVKLYQDPVYGESKDAYTHYAVPVGKNTLFPPEGIRMSKPDAGLAALQSPQAIRINTITDGTSNTIAVVPVDPARKIPWTKPEDITVGENFPGLGAPNGIAAPYPTADGKTRLAPVAFADGSVRTIASTIDPRVLGALLTRNGGEIIADNAIPGSPQDDRRPIIPMLKIRRAGDGRFTLEID
jgi:hypothetical protein